MDNTQLPMDSSQSSTPPVPPPMPPPQEPHRTRPAGFVPLPPERRGGRSWVWITLGLCLLAFVAFLGLFLAGMMTSGGGGSLHTATAEMPLQELVVRDGDGPDKIAMVHVEGIITGSSFDGSGASMVDYIKQQLKRAAGDDAVKAVVLKVDSPGGEVLASDEIYDAIRKFQDEEGKPVVAVMKSMAASGGYYVSARCRWIVAHELTITGSIGVIMQGYNFRGLMDKVGVRPQVFKSGKFKDMMGSTRLPEDVTDEEKRMMQQLIDEAFGRFKSIVREGRAYAADKNNEEGRALVPNWADYADGRILTGRQAHEHGFVDELGDLDTALARAHKLAGVSEARVVRYQRVFNFANIFQLFGKSDATSVKLDLGVDLPPMQAGRMYFLPSTFLP